jgi:DNA-3-methyladenine glycosylase I
MKRCPWAQSDEMIAYHDAEWGVPQHDDRVLFEFLILEGAQAGLSWATILKRRAGYRKAFANFDPKRVARFDAKKIATLLKNPDLIRNRLKIEGTVRNARAFLMVQKEFGTFDRYLWGFVEGKPIQNTWKSMRDVPAETAESRVLSKDLRRRGFTFVGPTICYALMQAVGMVNDHLPGCFRRTAVRK